MKKNWMLAAIMLFALYALAGCAAAAPGISPSPQMTAPPTPEAMTPTPEPQSPAPVSSIVPSTSPAASETYTINQLAAFNGKDGKPSYIAVNGIVYDVSNNKAWKNGMHEGYSAGLDLTKDIEAAPHGMDILKQVPVVGRIISQ